MITITTNARQVAAGLDKAAQQMPFAAALALTRTAQAAQADVRSQLGESFTLRNGWVSKGMRITAAKKANLEATVYTKDWFMALHQQGGERVSTSPGKDAIPIGARVRPRDMTRKASYPGKLLGDKSKRGYKVKLKDGVIGVFKRKRKDTNDKRGTVLMWIIVKQATVKADWPFDEQIAATVARVLPNALKDAIAHAIATAKPKA